MRLPPAGIALRALCSGVLLWTLGGCGLEKPAAPAFETDLYVPLGEQGATGRDLIEDSEYIEGDSTGQSPLDFVMRGDLTPLDAAAALDLDVPASSFDLSLGSIAIEEPEPVEVGIPLTTATGRELPPTNIVDPFRMEGVRAEVPDQDSFDWVHLEAGACALRIRNRLGVDLGRPAGELLRIRLVDRLDGHRICEMALGRVLPAGDSAFVSTPLSRTDLHNRIDVELWGESEGSGGRPLRVDPSSQVLIGLSFQDLSADSAVAAVPGQGAGLERSLPLEGGVHLQRGEIDEGRVDLLLHNSLPLATSARICLSDIQRGGEAVERTVSLPAAGAGGPGEATASIDLAGTTLIAPLPGATVESIRYTVDAVTEPAGAPVPIGTRQEASGQVRAQTVHFAAVEGEFEERTIALQPTDTAFDPPEGIDQLDFQAARLELHVASTVGLPSRAELLVEGIPEDGGSSVLLPVSFPVPAAADGGAPVVATAIADQTNSDILDLIGCRPRRLRVTGRILVGRAGEEGSVRRTDTVEGSYTLIAPMRMAIGEVEHRADPFRTILSSEDRRRIRENLVSGLVQGEVENGFPAGLAARLLFAGRQEDLAARPDLALDPISVGPAEIDPATGRALRKVSSQFTIRLSEEQITFFDRNVFYGQVIFTVHGPSPGAVVEMTASDSVRFHGLLHFRLRVTP